MQPRGWFQTPPACPIGHRSPQCIKQRRWHFDYARGSKLSTIAAYFASTSVCDVTRLSGLSAGAVRHGIPLITRFERRQGPSRGGGRAIHCPTQGLRQFLTLTLMKGPCYADHVGNLRRAQTQQLPARLGICLPSERAGRLSPDHRTNRSCRTAIPGHRNPRRKRRDCCTGHAVTKYPARKPTILSTSWRPKCPPRPTKWKRRCEHADRAIRFRRYIR